MLISDIFIRVEDNQFEEFNNLQAYRRGNFLVLSCPGVKNYSIFSSKIDDLSHRVDGSCILFPFYLFESSEIVRFNFLLGTECVSVVEMPVHIKSDSSFKKILNQKYQRPNDIETLCWLCYSAFNNKNINISYRISSFVIFLYKTIDNEEIISSLGIESIDRLVDFFIDMAYENKNVRSKSVRLDGIQVFISILTAAYHYYIKCESYDKFDCVLLRFLDFVDELILSEYDLNISYAKNIGSVMLIGCYVSYLSSDYNLFKKYLDVFFKVIKRIGLETISDLHSVGVAHVSDISWIQPLSATPAVSRAPESSP